MAAMRPVPRYSPLTRITRDNVSKLVCRLALSHGRTGPRALRDNRHFEVTPIVVDNVMYISTPVGKVMALDPATGREIWRYDARVESKVGYGDFASRGVATGVDSTLKPRNAVPAPHLLSRRWMRGSISLDAASGSPCVVFGV